LPHIDAEKLYDKDLIEIPERIGKERYLIQAMTKTLLIIRKIIPEAIIYVEEITAISISIP